MKIGACTRIIVLLLQLDFVECASLHLAECTSQQSNVADNCYLRTAFLSSRYPGKCYIPEFEITNQKPASTF
jgi:hypothetical protein